MLSKRLVVLKDGSNIKTLTNSQFNKNLITRALLNAPELLPKKRKWVPEVQIQASGDKSIYNKCGKWEH